MNNILGLDISTTRTGYCILDPNGTIIKLDVLDFTNKKNFSNIYHKAQAAETFLDEMFYQYKIDKVIIEAALMGFRPGMSSAATISTLMRFNGIFSWLVYKVGKMEPSFISATSARKRCGITISKGQKAKMVVMEHLLKSKDQFSGYVKYTRTGSIKPACYDMMDAYILCKSNLS